MKRPTKSKVKSSFWPSPKCWPLFFFILSLGLSPFPNFAQKPILKSFSTEDGLPSSHIYWTHEDREGYIWVCTDKGIARFDGYNFEVYSVKDGLPNTDVWGIEEDQQGRLWFNTFDQLVYWQDGKIHQLPFPLDDKKKTAVYHQVYNDTLHFTFIDLDRGSYYRIDQDNQVKEIQLARQDIAFAYRTSELDKLAAWQEAQKHFRLEDDKITYNIRPFDLPGIVDSEQTFPLGPFTLNLGVWALWHFHSSAADRLLFTEAGTMAIQGDSAFFRSWDEVSGIPLEPYQFSCFAKDRYLISSLKKSIVIDEQLNPLDSYAYLSDYSAHHITVDQEQNYWISTNHKLYLLTASATQSKTLPSNEYFNNSSLTNLVSDDRGVIWIGTYRGELYRYENGKLTYKTTADAPVRALLFNEQGELLMGGDWGWHVIPIEYQDDRPLDPKLLEGLNWYERKFPVPPFPASVTSNPMGLKAAIRGKGEELWYTSHRGFFHFEPDSGFTNIDEIRSYALSRDADNRIWVARTSGVSSYHEGELKEMSAVHPVFNYPINDLKNDPDGGLWLATNGLGLYRYTEEHLDTIHEVEDEIIHGLVLGKEKEIWFMSNQGIGQIQVLEENPFRYRYRPWSATHGLASSEVNDILLVGDEIFAATKEGLSILPQAPIGEIKSKPKLKLESVLINNQEFPLQSSYDLGYRQNNLQLRYVALSYKSLGRLEYDYRLEGLDSTWRRTTALELNYPALAPGNYPLSLRARDMDQGIESDIMQISFRIRPPWWQALWFRLLVLGATVLTFLVVLRWRIRVVERRAEARNEINQKMAELELRALQAQMNPHFVFNALQAIQDFIFNKDELVANQYLVKFSRLMRLFLESSKESYISLNDELDLLRLYIELEKMRFEDQFEYQIEVDPSLLEESIEIPSMILQPFVENAINHGLRYKEGPGKLQLKIQPQGEQLLCQIIDDGVGREKANELRKRSYKSHKSRGSQLVEERRRILEIVDQSPIDIFIEDLKDSNGVGRGTKVSIKIRYALN